MLRFDANLRCLFTEVPLLGRYEAAAMAGFRGVEIAFPYEEPARELERRLEDLGLTLVQILSPFDWDAGLRGIAALPGRENEFRGSIARAIDYALEVGKPMVHVMAGKVESGVQRERCLDVFETNLAYAADLARPEGITLIIEPCCAARFPHYLFKRVAEGVRIIERVGRDNVRLCFDTFHVQMEEGAITPKLESAWAHVGHIQIGNVPGRHEPGTGEIHFPYLFSQIERLDWHGWIGCEYTPSGPTLDTLGWGAPYGIGLRTTAGVAKAHIS